MTIARRHIVRLGAALLVLAPASAALVASCAPASPARTSPTLDANDRSPQAAVDALLAADRAFSAASTAIADAAGDRRMFAADAVMPLPGADGSFATGAAQVAERLRANPANAGARLQWAPVRGGISADGTHGFTYGYGTLQRADGARVPIKYLAYWVRGADGWRVAVYKRAPRAEGAVDQSLVAPALPAAMVPPHGDAARIARIASELDAAERAFSDRAQVVGLGPSFTEYGSADAVNMGGLSSAAFVVGSAAIGRAVSEGDPPGPAPVSWAPDRVLVASSGDLGVTIGVIRQNAPNADGTPPRRFPFFTIWRRAGPGAPWRYVAE